MEKIAAQGRVIFAIAIMAFGVENFICARFTGASVPVIPWVPPNLVWAYVTGIIFVATGLCIAINFRPRWAAILLGMFFLVCVLVLQIPRAFRDSFSRTGTFEILALCGGALTLARTLPPARYDFRQWAGMLTNFLMLGRFLFAISSVIFGIDHFLYLHFVASLVPVWIPGGLFWAAFTGAAFIATGLSIVVKWMDRWATFLLGIMFLLWFLLLHSPRVISAAHSHNPNEWSSAFMALGMCGASWTIASVSLRHRQTKAMG
jgi:uncharacterized membrane protein YphA (DoxX/SURF4 family)